MPGKPQRHKLAKRLREQFEASISAIPLLRARYARRKMSDEERIAFAEAVCFGLASRLLRKDPKDFEIALEVIEQARSKFKWDVRTVGLTVAKATVTFLVSELSSRVLAKARKPSPIDLLFENVTLHDAMPTRQDNKGRVEWLVQEGLHRDDAEAVVLMSDADLIEEVQAKRRGISKSEVRKILAKAQKQLKA